MATSRVILGEKTPLLQSAIHHILPDVSFLNHWTSATTLCKGIHARYKFDKDMTISKSTISRAIRKKIEPSLDTHGVPHSSGIYSGAFSRERFYFFKDLVSPLHPFHPFVKTILFGSSVSGWSSIIVSITFLFGLQFFCLGILGLYIGKIFEEVKKRPLFIIDDRISFNLSKKLE